MALHAAKHAQNILALHTRELTEYPIEKLLMPSSSSKDTWRLDEWPEISTGGGMKSFYVSSAVLQAMEGNAWTFWKGHWFVIKDGDWTLQDCYVLVCYNSNLF